jgi:hypothetical protein
MVSNKENRDSKPKTEGEKHQGVGANPDKKHASSSDESKAKPQANPSRDER